MTTATTVTETGVPTGTAIHAALPGAHFADSYETADPQPDAQALQVWLDIVSRTPRWTIALMALRNRLVRLVGLKDLGQLGDGIGPAGAPSRSAASYRVGDRVGIFRIRHLDAREVILGQDDRHLDVQVSLAKRERQGRPLLAVSTVVHVHNRLGHAYMAVVAPAHRRIVPAMLARVHGAR